MTPKHRRNTHAHDTNILGVEPTTSGLAVRVSKALDQQASR